MTSSGPSPGSRPARRAVVSASASSTSPAGSGMAIAFRNAFRCAAPSSCWPPPPYSPTSTPGRSGRPPRHLWQGRHRGQFAGDRDACRRRHDTDRAVRSGHHPERQHRQQHAARQPGRAGGADPPGASATRSPGSTASRPSSTRRNRAIPRHRRRWRRTCSASCSATS